MDNMPDFSIGDEVVIRRTGDERIDVFKGRKGRITEFVPVNDGGYQYTLIRVSIESFIVGVLPHEIEKA